MCTVVVRVPEQPGEPVRVLAIRDEDPARPWRPPGAWWPGRYAGVRGVQDVRAGGAWLAVHPRLRRLAVLLNRADDGSAGEDAPSRGWLPLEAVSGRAPASTPATRGFNLVQASPAGVRVWTWDGQSLASSPLAPGTHMVSHDDVDDPRTARIARWLPAFRDAQLPSGPAWYAAWLGIVADSAALDPTDDEALIRDHRHLGIPTLSLMVCAVTVGAEGTDLVSAALPAPGRWGPIRLT